MKKKKNLKEVNLAKGISELENEVEMVWEPPDIYDDVTNDNIWVVYGRKGSGKSHLIDFLKKDVGREQDKDSVFTIRPREDQLFQLVMTAINEVNYDDERLILENIAASLDFVVTTLIMKEGCSVDGFLSPASERETIYNFLCSNDLVEGSIPRKAIKFLSKLTGGHFKLISNLSEILNDNQDSKGFTEAKKCLWDLLENIHGRYIICIDDIDEIGFSFSRIDRLFVNALIVMMLRFNFEFCRKHLPIRVLLTCPSELFFHSTLWGDDWVETRSRCLRWLHHDSIQKLVNKRIGAELNIKKNNPASPTDIYSDSTQNTWNKIFPTTIINKTGRSESALKYILRHTFYTPRHILQICDKILHCLGSRGFTIEDLSDANFSKDIWNTVFREKVEEYTYNIDSSFHKLYGKIYDGIDDVCYAFQSRPSMWTKSALSNFVERKNLKVKRKETGKVYSGASLITKLQHLGFLGLGTQDFMAPPMSVSFNMRFSFLEKLPTQRPWELAVISPIFYDPYGIRPSGNVKVVPHENITIPNSTWHEIMRYTAF